MTILEERYGLQTTQNNTVSLPFPSVWGIHATIAARPIVWGTITINSVTGNRVMGTVNFRGTQIPIQGFWNENAKQISLNSPYASYSGTLSIFDDAAIRVRHYTLSGQIVMTPPSPQAGQTGTWVATTNTALTGNPIISNELPPVGVFLTSDLLNQTLR